MGRQNNYNTPGMFVGESTMRNKFIRDWVAIVRNHFGRTEEEVEAGMYADQVRFRFFSVPEDYTGDIVDPDEKWDTTGRRIREVATHYYMNQVDRTSELLLVVPACNWGGNWLNSCDHADYMQSSS